MTTGCRNGESSARPPLFDAHFHVIDPRFPLVANRGYLPDPYPVEHYQARTSHLNLVGGAVVSGSFQAFDQTYLTDALARLGPGFVGVTQLSTTVADEEVLRLAGAGVRAVRVNLYRGGPQALVGLDTLARRVWDLAGWHTECYLDATDLTDLAPLLTALPRISIDHLGLTQAGLGRLLRLVEHGASVKASGFGRGDIDVPAALRAISSVNPAALMIGTDLPGTRSPHPFQDTDLDLVIEALDPTLAAAAFSHNAVSLYRP